MKFKRFEEMEVWKRGCRLAVEIFKLTGSEDLAREWGLKDQMRRAVISIPSNIAEGYERNSQKEFKRFLLIAKGSCGELRTQIYILKAIGLGSDSVIDPLIKETTELSSMIQSLVSIIQSRAK